MDAQRNKKMRQRRRIIGELAILAGLIAYLLVNINDYLNTPMIKGAIFQAINRSFYGRLYAGRVKAHLWAFEAEGWDVGAVDMHERHMGFSPHARIKFNPLSFFWRRVRMEEIELDEPVFKLWTDPDHVFVWRKFKRPPRKKYPIFRVRAGEVIAHNGKFTYDYYPDPKVHVYLEGINARAGFVEKTPAIQGTIKKLHLNYNRGSFDGWFKNLVLYGVQDSEFASVAFLYAKYLNMPVFISGDIRGFSSKDPRLDFHINLLEDEKGEKPKIADLLRHFKYHENPPGEFSMTAHVTGRSGNFRVAGTFISPWGVIEGQRYDNFRADYDYHSDDHRVYADFSMKMYGMSFKGHGWHNIYNGSFHVTGTMTHRGRVMRYDIAGNIDTERDVMNFSRWEVKSADSALSGRGGSWDIGRGVWDLTYRLAVHDLAGELIHWRVEGFRGGLDVKGVFKGPLSDPEMTARGNAANLEWNRAFIGSGPIDAKLENGNISATLSTTDRGAKFKGDLQLPLLRNGEFISLRVHPFSFHMEMQGFRITTELFDTDFTGVASGKLEGEGTTVNLNGRGEITLRDVGAWGQSVKTMRADLAMTQSGIGFENARITLPSGDKGKGSLWVDWDMNYKLSVESGQIHLSSLNKVQEEDMPLEGAFSFKAHGKGNFDLVKIDGHADFGKITYDTLDMGGGELDVYLKGAEASLVGEFYEDVSVCGYYDVETGFFDNFVVAFDGTPLYSVFDWLGVRDSGGEVTGMMTLNGGGETWGDVDFLVEIMGLDLKVKKERIRNEGLIRLEIGPSGGREDVHLTASRGRLDITGSLSPDEEWDIHALAVVDLESVASLMYTMRRASGIAVFDAHITGPSERLKMDGAFMVGDGSFKFRGYRGEFSHVEALLLFTPEQVTISRFLGKIDEDGAFSFTGKALYEGMEITAFDVSMEADGITYSKPAEYKVVFSPRLNLSGNPGDMLLRGIVEITDGRYVKDVRIDKQVVKLERETAPEIEMPGWVKNLKLDITIEDDGNFRIRNNLTDVYLTTDLNISGPLSSLTLDGIIKSHEGKMYYGGDAFDLVRANVDFSDPFTNDPDVDIFGRTDVRQWEIRLYLEGKLSKMQLRLESSPLLDDQAILSLLTFRRLPNELNQSQASALVGVGLLGQSPITKKVGELTGLNIAPIEAGSNRPGEPIEFRVELSDRLALEYSTDTTGQEQVRETKAIYKLTDTMWLVGAQNNLGEYSLEIKFRFQFE